MAYYNAPRSMNVGGMDLLNFFDIRDKDGDRGSTYDETKDPKQHLESCCGDVDEINGIGLSRKESRIPVAVRRLRSRTDRLPVMNDGQTSHLRADNKLEDWPCAWGQTGGMCEKNDKKLNRLNSHMKPITDTHLIMDPMEGMNGKRMRNVPLTGSAPQFTCVKCGRSCMMINRDGVYVALSVGLTPLLLLCLFFICVLFGWLGMNFGLGPSVLHRLQVSPPPSNKQRGGWIGKWFIK